MGAGAMHRPLLQTDATFGEACWAATIDECRREFIRVAHSFWIVPELIPPTARDDIAVLYCFCRRLDDTVDDSPEAAQARAALALWRDELSGRAPARPLVEVLLASVRRNGLPSDCIGHLLDGMAADLGPVRIADDDELLRYAYRVSTAVGLLVAPLFGIRGADADARVVDRHAAGQVAAVAARRRGELDASVRSGSGDIDRDRHLAGVPVAGRGDRRRHRRRVRHRLERNVR